MSEHCWPTCACVSNAHAFDKPGAWLAVTSGDTWILESTSAAGELKTVVYTSEALGGYLYLLLSIFFSCHVSSSVSRQQMTKMCLVLLRLFTNTELSTVPLTSFNKFGFGTGKRCSCRIQFVFHCCLSIECLDSASMRGPSQQPLASKA